MINCKIVVLRVSVAWFQIKGRIPALISGRNLFHFEAPFGSAPNRNCQGEYVFCSVSCCALTPPKVSDQVRTALTPKSLRAPARRAGGFKIHCSTHGSRLSLSRLSSPYPVAALARARPTGNNRHRKPSLALGLRPTGSAARFLCKLLCFCVNCSKTVPETVVFLCKLL